MVFTSNLAHKQKQYTYDTNAKVHKYKESVGDQIQVGAIWFSHNKIDTKEHKQKVQVGANFLSLVT